MAVLARCRRRRGDQRQHIQRLDLPAAELLRCAHNDVNSRRRLHFKDYRIEGPGRHKRMTLETGEIIRRFLIHVLHKGFHRIRLNVSKINDLFRE
jgi:Putative transposase